MLYYVDISSQPLIEEFVPRIPEHRMSDEDAEIERICLAKTIEGCFSASSELEELVSRHKHCPYEVFRLYVFDEKDIQKGNLTDSELLWKEQLVPDANLTGEVWIEKQTLIPKEVKYISVNNLSCKQLVILSPEELQDYNRNFHILNKFKSKNNILLDKFVELTEDNSVQRKSVFYDMDIYFYDKDELLFPIKKKTDFSFESFCYLNLSKYLPNIEDFRCFKGHSKFDTHSITYFAPYEFTKEGINFPYGCGILCKEKFLEMLT